MKMLDLSPFVTLQLWKNSPIGIVRVGDPLAANFAILQVRALGYETAARFELPEHGPQLQAAVLAMHAAYALGHHDRKNRMRALLGCAPVDVLVPCERTAADV